MREALSTYPAPVLEATPLTQRVIFAEAAACGLSVGEDPGGSAEMEIKMLLDELRGT